MLLRPPAAGAAAHPCLLEQLELEDPDTFGRARACGFASPLRRSAASKELISDAISAFRLDFSSVQQDRAVQHDATRSARLKRAGFISEAILDGTGQWAGWADSSKQGSSDQARGADRQRSAPPGLDHAMIMFWTLDPSGLRSIDMRWSC